MRNKLNFIIDSLLLLLLVAISGIGFLIKYILIPGKDRIVRFGKHIDLYFLGLDRHDWGTIHLVLGFIFLALMLLHIVLHWNVIKCLFERFFTKSHTRTILTIVFTLFCLFLLFFPFLFNAEIVELPAGEGHQAELVQRTLKKTPESKALQTNNPRLKNKNEDAHHVQEMHNPNILVNGQMTLREVQQTYQIPIDTLQKGLNIRGNFSENERLGRLRRQFGFRMHDIEKIIDQYQKNHKQ